MKSIGSIEDLKALREEMKPHIKLRHDAMNDTKVLVGMGTSGIAAGARPVLLAFAGEVQKNGLDGVSVMQTGCFGDCSQEPVVEVAVPGKEKVVYVKMTPEKAARVVKEHLIGGKVVTEYTACAAK